MIISWVANYSPALPEPSMVKAFSLVVLFSYLLLARSQEKPKGPKNASPREVIKAWNNAVAKRDMKTVARLASKSTPKATLKLIQQQLFLNYQGETKIIHEEISGQRAIVVYRLENRGAVFTPEVRYDIAGLVREDGQWKVAQDLGGVLKEGKQTKR
jgi:hypothetical protein